MRRRTELAEANPEVIEYQQELIQSHHNMGVWKRITARSRKDLQYAEDHFRKALAISGRIDFPLSPDLRSQHLRTAVNLAAVQEKVGRRQEAMTAYREAAQGYESLTRLYPLTPAYGELLGQVYNQLASLTRRECQFADEERFRLQSLALWEQMVKRNPSVPKYESDLALTHVYLGEIDKDRQKPKEAATHWRLAESIWARLLKDHPHNPDIGLFKMNLNLVRKDLNALGGDKK